MSLQSFDLLTSESHLLSIGELEGHFVYATEEDISLKAAGLGLQGPPPIFISLQTGDVSLISSNSTPLGQLAFLPTQEYWLKTAWRLLRNEGSVKALEFLSEDTEDERGGGGGGGGQLVTSCATNIMSCFRKLNQFSSWFYSQSVDPHDVCNHYACTSLWSSSVIRDISIHPFLPLVAIARKDDVIVIKNTQTQQFLRPLKDKHQYCIAAVEWAPLSSNLLAVGVVGGVVLWHIDPNTRPICTFLSCFPQQPVVSLSWCPQGTFLACGSPNNHILIIWDIGFQHNTLLKRYRGGGISHINWSPTGGKLLVSHQSLFRVWESVHWTSEKWTQLVGRCNSSCWSPKGDLLLFSVEGDTSLYYVRFSACDSSFNSSVNEAAIKCADVSECYLNDNQDIRVGGTIQSLAWDHTGRRLAVLFTVTSPGVSRIAIFRTQCYPVLTLIPGGFIQWIEGTLPVWVGFTSNHRNWSILVSAWNDGHIIFTPLLTELSQGTMGPPLTTISGLFSQTLH